MRVAYNGGVFDLGMAEWAVEHVSWSNASYGTPFMYREAWDSNNNSHLDPGASGQSGNFCEPRCNCPTAFVSKSALSAYIAAVAQRHRAERAGSEGKNSSSAPLLRTSAAEMKQVGELTRIAFGTAINGVSGLRSVRRTHASTQEFVLRCLTAPYALLTPVRLGGTVHGRAASNSGVRIEGIRACRRYT
jgi:hypothetical protein